MTYMYMCTRTSAILGKRVTAGFLRKVYSFDAMIIILLSMIVKLDKQT